ncbi:MAG: IS30 family transposase [Parcubacteria group bacterium]|jgi:IS30 family transposase
MSKILKYKHFKQNERNEIAILLKKDYSLRDIGYALGRNPSSVSREIKLNSVSGVYDPRKAKQKARTRRKHSKYQCMKIRELSWLEKYVSEKLQACWTPEQIAGRLKSEHGYTIISAKSIYEYIYSVYGQHLSPYLTYKQFHKRKGGVRKRGVRKRGWGGGIRNRVSIDDRPAVVNERSRFGDFEADTLGAIKTDKEVLTGITERLSRFLILEKVPRLKYAMDGFKKSLNPYQNIVQTMTFDNGFENSRYAELNVDTYFCHPFSSWEKGGIENTFGRLRRFIPKKESLKSYSPEKISAIMKIMNDTPRKCLGYKTPTEVFNEQLSLTGVALEGKM